MPTSTLTSLAILKVNVDRGRDYLDYLIPFTLEMLAHRERFPISTADAAAAIRDQFGLELPERTLQIVLNRIARHHPLQKKAGLFHKVGHIQSSQFPARQAEAERHIRAVLADFRVFAEYVGHPLPDDAQAVEAICTFLAEFDITCLRAYLRGTAIPNLSGTSRARLVLVSDYVQHLNRTNPQRFDSFSILVQGNMLANALICPDLDKIPRSYRNVTFYLDTPLVIERLGCDGDVKRRAVQEWLTLVVRLGGRVAMFYHSRRELVGVLKAAAMNLENPGHRGRMVLEARKNGTTKSDLLLLAASIDDELERANIRVENTPPYIHKLQIDETVFEQVLDDEVSYYNPRAKEYDINSVRSVYVLRGRRTSPSLEKSRAVLVTSNAAFARAAWEYGQKHESSKGVSSVINDFTLANTAWLKTPLEAPSIPITQLLAVSYAALQPSPGLLSQYLDEIDRLEQKGSVTPRDLELLRSSHSAQEYIVRATLGDEDAMSPETVIRTLERVTSEIKEESETKVRKWRERASVLSVRLEEEKSGRKELTQGILRRCRLRATFWAKTLMWLMMAVLLCGFYAGFESQSWYSLPRWLEEVSTLILAGAGFVNLIKGTTVERLINRLEDALEKFFLDRELSRMGIDRLNTSQ